MQKSTVWSESSLQQFVTQQYRSVLVHSIAQPPNASSLSRPTWHCVVVKNQKRSGRASSFHASTFSFASILHTRTTPGVRKLSSGGTRMSIVYSPPSKSSQLSSKVFGDPSESDEEVVEMRDTQGPSMRERMDMEWQARMQAATGN